MNGMHQNKESSLLVPSVKETILNLHGISRALCLSELPLTCNNHKTEILIHILRKCTQTLALLFFRWSYQRVLILIIFTLILSSAIHTGAHLVNFRRFSSNYSFEFTDLNFASYPDQVRSRVWFSLDIFYSVSVHSVYTKTPSLL